MPLVRGLTLLDLIAQVPPGAQGFVPASVDRFISLLNIAHLSSRSSGAFFIHQGMVQSAEEAGLTLGPDFPIEIPGLNVGVPFQLSWQRDTTTGAVTDLEDQPTGWTLDLVLDRVAVVIPIGQAARLVPTAAVAPAYLEPDGGGRVKLYARGVLRVQGGAAGTQVRLISAPDPLVPTSVSGAVIETGFSPPHLLLHDSGFGLTVKKVVLDLSDTFTPEDIVARQHGPEFEGMTIEEATLYLPRNIPFLGDVNFGVRDLLVGWAPTTALQGTARLELGVPLESATGIRFFQAIGGAVHDLGGSNGAFDTLSVKVHASTGATARLFAVLATNGIEAVWHRPDGRSVQGHDSGWFDVSLSPGAPSLEVTELRTDGEGKVSDGQVRSFRFERATPSTEPTHAPFIVVRYANAPAFSHEWTNVAFLRGPGGALDFVRFSADTTGLPAADVTALRWRWESQGSTREGQGAQFDLDTGWAQGVHTVTLTNRQGHVRRVRIEVTPEGPLYVGRFNGQVQQVEGATVTAPTLLSVENTWDLAAFHARDDRRAATAAARLSGGTLTVPKGALAEVTLGVGTPANPVAPAPTAEPPFRHMRLRMTFNQTDPTGWRLIRRAGGNPYGPATPYPRFAGAREQVNTPEEALHLGNPGPALQQWVQSLPAGARFIVVGRCCDLGTEARNRQLANDRAEQGKTLLVAAGVLPDAIRVQGEQGQTTAANEPGYKTALSFTTPAFSATDDAQMGAFVNEGWRIKSDYADSERNAWGTTQNLPQREEARGVDIYVVCDEAAVTSQPTGALTQNPSLVRVMTPGADADVIAAMAPANVQLPYRVEVLVTWDSPSVMQPIDWVPTLAQLTVEWASSEVAVPGLPGQSIQPTRPGRASASDQDLWRLITRFSTDPRSGQTQYLLSLDSMGDSDGLFAIVSPDTNSRADEAVAVALALAPALLGGITTTDPAGAAVRVGALVAASAAAAAVKFGSDHVINDGSVIVEKIEGRAQLRALDAVEGMKVRIGVDYTASFNVKASLGGAVGVQTLQPVKIKYKNVGLEYENDTSKPVLERLHFVFEDAKFEVADPGQWSITGALGRFLGITAIRVGAGSVWVEVDLEFAIDLGVVKISRTTIRVEIDTDGPSLSVQLRGITAQIDVPNVIKGQGALQVLSDGFGASVELDVIPAKLKAWGGFAIRDPNMVHIEGGVRFATGIPLANTGLGLFGFAGRFVANGTRNVDLANTDIIGREIGWHRAPVIDPDPAKCKYRPQPGQFAVGFGAYIGTLPDAAFTFNALGMLTVGFPDISVVFSIDALLLTNNGKAPEETKSGSTGANPSFQLLGIVAVDPTAVGLAIQGTYQIPQVLTLEVPIGAYFPLQGGPTGAYVRIGSDGFGGRPNRPVTIRILPEVLDLRALSFFMVEEKGILDLGGKPNLDFQGFSIGFGTGLSIQWGGGPIYLKASMSLLAGLGTRPFVLAGGFYVQGELRLIVISVSVHGEVEARVTDTSARLDGEFCGKVDFFFFSVEGCVSFGVGTEPTVPLPPMAPLVTGLTLADKFSRVVGEGHSSLAGLGDAHTAWPDTMPVLRFASRVRSKITGTGFQPSPSQGWGGCDWSGTNRVRYLHELQSVTLLKHPAGGGAPVALDTSSWPAAWWLPSFRPGVPESGSTPASAHEGWDLALLKWDPAPWSRAHSEGGEGLDADPATNLGRVCTPAPRPTRYCVLGGRGERFNIDRVRLAGLPSGQLPYPPDFQVDLQEGLPPQLTVGQLSAVAAGLGLGFQPGGAEPLPQPFTPPGEAVALDSAWRAPRLTRGDFTAMSLGMVGRFMPEVSDPVLLLAVCIDLPDLGGRRETCLDIGRLKVGTNFGATLTLDGVRFEDRAQALRTTDSFPLGAPDARAELAFGKAGLFITLPADSQRVTMDIGHLEDRVIVVQALDAQGNEVARAQSQLSSPGVHAVLLEPAAGKAPIRQVVVFAPFGTGRLIRFCHDAAAEVDEGQLLKRILAMFDADRTPAPVTHVAARASRLPLPRVFGTLAGQDVEWPGEIVGLSVQGHHGCVYVRYQPKQPRGPWSRFVVAPYPWFSLALVRVCGVRHSALVAAEDDEQAREDMQDGWNDAASGPSIKRYQLLDPASRYEVRVQYRAAVWVGANATATPPDASTLDFSAPPAGVTVSDQSQSFFFQTAAAGVLPDDKVPAFEAQQRFDPRALSRYVRGFDPVAEVPSHLRDDPLLVWFEVEWIEDLLDRYGHDLKLVVQRTDPPPTPPSGAVPVLLPPFTVNWKGLPFELRNLADRRMIEHAMAAPCLENAPREGATAEIKVDLVPRARYDVVVLAQPRTAGSPPVEVARSHFRASRYADAQALIEATGFGVGQSNPYYPLDLLVSAAPPADVRLGDDALLDQALSAMGLDPFAPATSPRSVVLWREIAGQWRLVGLLLDSDEALIRGPRLVDPTPNANRLEITGAQVTGVAAPGTSTLQLVRSNQSATRVLLAAPTGIAVPAEATLQLAIKEPSGSWIAERNLLSVPLIVAQERP